MSTKPSDPSASLAATARALLDATADAAGEGIAETRERLTTALGADTTTIAGVRDFYGRVKCRVVDGAKAIDGAVHVHPYASVAISAGVGTLVGLMLSRGLFCCSKKG
ncbi:MAG: DUF883 family protein [Planctomycetota bacterium]|nr:MAG: DUF883 family protein [Planctomycetota bacterium]